MYARNAKKERLEADIFNYLMMLINFGVVILVIYKTIHFPDVVACLLKPATDAVSLAYFISIP